MVAGVLLLQLALAPIGHAAQGAAVTPHFRPDSALVPTAGLHAARAASSIAIDGDLGDAAWTGARVIADFRQREPKEGEAASERTEVRILWDEDALYVAAELLDHAPDSVIALLDRRDRWVNADRFTVMLDPFHDRRSGYYFGVNAAGTLYDGTLFNDDWDDSSWDGVWAGASRRTARGWAVEMRIPFSQLRFRPGASQVWGINFRRDIARKNERDFLVYTPQNGSGFVSRFPELTGLDGLATPRRIELMPYATMRAEYLAAAAGGNPFNDGSRYAPGVGADLKVGVGANLNLTGTINPDFGQVEVDPAVVNLSDVEVFFPERRPFFVEGSNIFDFGFGGSNNFWGFNWTSHDFLYSRRIGRTPAGASDAADFTDRPLGTTILGAAKLSGRVGGWNVGALSALTDREWSRNAAAGGDAWRNEIEPMTSWNTLRLQNEIDGGRQGIGVIATATQRFFGDDGTALRSQMNRGAYTGGVDGWTFLDRNRTWVLTGWAGASLVTGDADRMTSLQRGAVHYFQRPDASHVAVDSAATSLAGWAGRLLLNKQKGNWMVNAALGAVAPGFELNDLGFQGRADLVSSHLVVGYRWTRPTSWYQRFTVNNAVFSAWDFGGNHTGAGLAHFGNFQAKNFARVRWSAFLNPWTTNVRQTRGGPAMLNPGGVGVNLGYSSDDRKRFLFGVDGNVQRYAENSDRSWGIDTWVEWKPTQKLALRVGPGYFRNIDGAQYVMTAADPLATRTYGARYLFGDLDQHTLSGNIRVNWIFTPTLSLELFLQPLVSSGRYVQLKELEAPRTFDFVRYGVDGGSTWDRENGIVDPDGAGPAAPIAVGNPDFTFTSLRGNAVMRWEWAPGSTLFLVWAHNRVNSAAVGRFAPGQSFQDLMQVPADNVLMAKVSWWFNP
jgi:hypothetical protein